MGDAGAKYEPSHRQLPPHVRAGPLHRVQSGEGGASPLPSMACTKSPWYSWLRSFSSRLKPRTLTISSTSDKSSFSSYLWRSIARCGDPTREPWTLLRGLGGLLSPWAHQEQVQELRGHCTPAMQSEQLCANAKDAGKQKRGLAPPRPDCPYSKQSLPASLEDMEVLFRGFPLPPPQ